MGDREEVRWEESLESIATGKSGSGRPEEGSLRLAVRLLLERLHLRRWTHAWRGAERLLGHESAADVEPRVLAAVERVVRRAGRANHAVRLREVRPSTASAEDGRVEERMIFCRARRGSATVLYR